MVTVQSAPWPLFGRGAEVEMFREALHDRRRAAFFIHGGPGTGKTRLAEECWEMAAREGRRCLRAVASEAARTVPLGAIGHLLPAQDGPADPVALFARTARLYAGGEPAVLFVDDLHLLDPTSAVLVAGLLNAGNMFLIGTLRSIAMAPDVMVSIGRGDQCQLVHLTELNLEQVDGLLRLILGGLVDAGACFRLHKASGGVPLFLRELVSGALSSGTLVGDGGVWRLVGAPTGTPQLIEVTEQRLTALSHGDRAVLEALALCGPLATTDFDSAALTRLETLGLIELRVGERRTEAAIVHPLYAEAVRGGTPLLRRREVLLGHAARLGATGMRRREDRLRQAVWLLEATGTADPALLRRATELARYASDFGSVVSLTKALIRLDPSAGPRMMLGEALYELGRFCEADAALRDAADAAVGDEEYLLATVLRTQSLAFAALRCEEAMAVNTAARLRLAGRPAQDALRVDQAALLTFAGEAARAAVLLDDLDEAADDRTRVMGAIPRAFALIESGHIVAAITVAETAHAEHLAMPGVVAAAHPSLHQGTLMLALVEAGRIVEARALGQRAYAHAVAGHALIAQMWLAIQIGKLEYLAGLMTTARAWFATAAAIAADHHFRGGQWLASAGLAQAIAGLGDAHGAQEASQRASELSPAGHRRADVAAAPCWVTAAAGHLSVARDMLADAAQLARATGSRTTEAQLLCDIARLGDPARVRDRLDQLAAQTDSSLTSVRAAYAAALVAGNPGQLEQVADRFEDMGAVLLAAEACASAARIRGRLESSRAGNGRAAAGTAARASRLADQCDGARTPGLALLDGRHSLTLREQEIALLAMAGRSTKEIAGQLVISIRTVDSHLQHIYQKTGVNRREDLRTALRGLTGQDQLVAGAESFARQPAVHGGGQTAGRFSQAGMRGRRQATVGACPGLNRSMRPVMVPSPV